MGALALLLRVVFSLGSVLIVLAATLDAWSSGQPLLALAAFVAFPVTFFVYPLIGGLEVLWIISMLAFWGGNVAAARARRP
jgi:hypothetical protein